MIYIKVSKIIKKIFKTFDLQPAQCLIIGSAILYELNIITDSVIRDIDIVIDQPSWEKLSQQYKDKVVDVRYGKSIIIKNEILEIEFLNRVGPEEFLFTTEKWIISNGIKFITLENLIAFYQLLNRPKDHVRIELIKKYLQQRRCRKS